MHLLILIALVASASAQTNAPAKVAPLPAPPVVAPGPPPADAIILFDGRDLSAWESAKGGPAAWTVADGAMTVNNTGNIRTRQAFGDCQLHLEWAAPAQVTGDAEKRGNSGVFLQGRYELQILDSHQNPTTKPGGMAGAIYNQTPPLVNASRPPGEWQTFDIVYRAPRFHPDGTLAAPARFTVLHNGVLVQDHSEVKGPTTWRATPPYQAHPAEQPLVLQDHQHPVRFRNIWLRKL